MPPSSGCADQPVGVHGAPEYDEAVNPETQSYLVEALANARAEAGREENYEAKERSLSHFAGVLAGFR